MCCFFDDSQLSTTLSPFGTGYPLRPLYTLFSLTSFFLSSHGSALSAFNPCLDSFAAFYGMVPGFHCFVSDTTFTPTYVVGHLLSYCYPSNCLFFLIPCLWPLPPLFSVGTLSSFPLLYLDALFPPRPSESSFHACQALPC